MKTKSYKIDSLTNPYARIYTKPLFWFSDYYPHRSPFLEEVLGIPE
jgi:hypothetical protein